MLSAGCLPLTTMSRHCFLLLWLAAFLAPSEAISVSSSQTRRDQEMVILPSGPMVRSEDATGDLQAAIRLQHKKTLTTGEDYRCSPSGVAPEKMGVPGAEWAETKKYGYCYYLGDERESCTETCMRQMGGACNAAGTENAAKTSQQCQMVLQAFSNGSTGIGHTENIGTSQNDRSGCTWIELAPEAPGASRVEVFDKDDYPLCSAVPQNTRSHRVCACTVFFGNFSMYESSVGNCHAQDGGDSHVRKAVHDTALECEDECTRDSQCGAFAFVDAWDGHPRQCHFFEKKHYVGDGVNKHIKCNYKKDLYLTTLGRCKKHFGKMEEKLAESTVSTVAECKAACDADEACEAFDIPFPVTQNSQCTLYSAGHTGNAVDGTSRCYTRATGGVSAFDGQR